MIYIETDSEGLCREMLGGFNDRKPLKVGGQEFVLTDITRNLSFGSRVSVEAKGEPVTPDPAKARAVAQTAFEKLNNSGFSFTGGPAIEFGYLKPSKAPNWGDCRTPYKIENFPGLQATPWNGEGKPPVGCECEAEAEVWRPVGILAHDGERVVFRWRDGPDRGQLTEYGPLGKFRPLRTAEQLAAEAREAEIDRLCRVVEAHPSYQALNRNIDCSAAMRLAVEAIVDNHKSAGLGE